MWPDYFPDQCPPKDSRKDEMTVFRLVSDSPPSARDFVPTIIDQPHRSFAPSEVCRACGVSVFTNIEDAKCMRSRFSPLRNKKLAIGTITQEDGVVLETGTGSHITWWLQTEQPQRGFREVSENGSV